MILFCRLNNRTLVSNSPCGVERLKSNLLTLFQVLFLIHRVELKEQMFFKYLIRTRVSNSPCGVESLMIFLMMRRR